MTAAQQNAEPLVKPQEVADFLGMPVATIHNWRARGIGPRAYRIGKHVRYRLSEVEAWVATRADGSQTP